MQPVTENPRNHATLAAKAKASKRRVMPSRYATTEDVARDSLGASQHSSTRSAQLERARGAQHGGALVAPSTGGAIRAALR